MIKKLFLVIATFCLLAFWALPCFSQVKVNVHISDLKDVKEDSSGSTTWILFPSEADTSEVLIIQGYPEIATWVDFGFRITAHADSLEVSIYGDISFDQVSWCVVDSFQGSSPLTVATIVAVCPDTCYYHKWNLATNTTFTSVATSNLTAPYFRIRIVTTASTADSGITATVKTLLQQ